MKPIAALIHVADIDSALTWYQSVFPTSQRIHSESIKLAMLDVDGFLIEIVEADDKVSSGKCGSVLYWSVANLNRVLSRFVSFGGKLYRGPMQIEDGFCMCQIEDPFGNLIGLRGVISREEFSGFAKS